MFQANVEEDHDDVFDDDQFRLSADDFQSPELTKACDIAATFFKKAGHDLISIIFCDCTDRKPTIRAYRNMPNALDEQARNMKLVGGCPPKKEAQRILTPFDWFELSPVRYNDLQSMKFLLEVSKLKYGCILGVPVRLGEGLAIFSIGIHKKNCNEDVKRQVIIDVLQLFMAMIGGIDELDELFENKQLTILEAKALLFAMQGYSPEQIAGFMQLSEITISLLFNSAAARLGATNHFQLISKAIANGEISNIQLMSSPDK